MKVIGSMERNKDKELTNGQMEVFIMDNGMKTKETVKENFFGLIMISILVIGKMIKEKVME